MTDSTENATRPKSTESRNSNSSVHIQIKSKSQFEFVPRDTEKSEFAELVDFGSVAISVGTVMFERSVSYGVATISRLLKTIGLFCRIQSLL